MTIAKQLTSVLRTPGVRPRIPSSTIRQVRHETTKVYGKDGSGSAPSVRTFLTAGGAVGGVILLLLVMGGKSKQKAGEGVSGDGKVQNAVQQSTRTSPAR